MKLLKLSTALLALTMMLFTSCKSKSPKDLIVNKWKVTDVSGEGAKNMSDAEKKDMVNKVVMDLAKDGKCSMSGMGDTPKTGTYTLSDDGKTLNLTRDGDSKPTPQQINELTADKLVITDGDSKMKITFSPK